MTGRAAYRRFWLILHHEPSWFAEIASAVGCTAWGAFALMSNNYSLGGEALIMPIIGLCMGPARVGLLFRLWPAPRVVAAAAGFLWWGWIACAVQKHFGIIPGIAPLAALALADFLTVLKFSHDAGR